MTVTTAPEREQLWPRQVLRFVAGDTRSLQQLEATLEGLGSEGDEQAAAVLTLLRGWRARTAVPPRACEPSEGLAGGDEPSAPLLRLLHSRLHSADDGIFESPHIVGECVGLAHVLGGPVWAAEVLCVAGSRRSAAGDVRRACELFGEAARLYSEAAVRDTRYDVLSRQTAQIAISCASLAEDELAAPQRTALRG